MGSGKARSRRHGGHDGEMVGGGELSAPVKWWLHGANELEERGFRCGSSRWLQRRRRGLGEGSEQKARRWQPRHPEVEYDSGEGVAVRPAT